MEMADWINWPYCASVSLPVNEGTEPHNIIQTTSLLFDFLNHKGYSRK